MGVNNVNAKQQIVQLALKKKGSAQVRKNPQLVYLSKNGSIFDAPGVNPAQAPATTPTRATIQDLNTRQSLDELNKKPVDATGSATDTGSKSENEESGDVSLGNVKSATSQTKGLTSDVKADAKTATKLGTSGAKLEKDIKTGNKTYTAKINQQQAELKKENERLAKVISQTEETQTLVTNAQNELDSLTSGGTVSASNRTRAAELQTYIGAKVGILQQNGKTIYSLQRSQSRVIARMNKMNTRYIKVQHAHTKAIENQQNQTNKVAETAAKVEEISAATQAGGQALALLGDAMIAAGSVGGWFGAGLVSVGMVFKKVGTVAELIGQYGQAAAGITKTAAYAADGELCAAMMSAASAIQSSMSAAKSTANIGKTFDAINEQGNAVIQNNVARSAAKDQVEQMVKDGTIEKSEAKTMRKAIQANIKEQMNGQDATIKTTKSAWNAVGQAKDYKAQLQDGTKATLADGTKGTAVKKAKEEALETLTNIKQTIADKNDNLSLDDNGKFTTKDGKTKIITKANKLAKKNFKAKISEKNKNFTNPISNLGESFSKFGSSATNIAAVFMQNEAIKGSTQKRQLEPFQLDARTRSIMQRNQRYRQHAAFV
ncbi:hypothetical protein J6P92_07070 [bacterium]|nr:hypothetical protein [bacterium]